MDRPDLNWRDLQYLSIQTAVPISLDDPDWKKTYTGRMYSTRYGYGRIDAYAVVTAARTFKSVNPQVWFQSQAQAVETDIPNGPEGISSSISISSDNVKSIGMKRLEHVQAMVSISHKQRGDIEMVLESPNGIRSQLITSRPRDYSTDGFKNWTLMSVMHW